MEENEGGRYDDSESSASEKSWRGKAQLENSEDEKTSSSSRTRTNSNSSVVVDENGEKEIEKEREYPEFDPSADLPVNDGYQKEKEQKYKKYSEDWEDYQEELCCVCPKRFSSAKNQLWWWIICGCCCACWCCFWPEFTWNWFDKRILKRKKPRCGICEYGSGCWIPCDECLYFEKCFNCSSEIHYAMTTCDKEAWSICKEAWSIIWRILFLVIFCCPCTVIILLFFLLYLIIKDKCSDNNYCSGVGEFAKDLCHCFSDCMSGICHLSSDCCSFILGCLSICGACVEIFGAFS